LPTPTVLDQLVLQDCQLPIVPLTLSFNFFLFYPVRHKTPPFSRIALLALTMKKFINYLHRINSCDLMLQS
jgi:hypothetical protein